MFRASAWVLVLFLVFSCANVQAFNLTEDQVREAVAKALHHDDPAVRQAAKLLKDKGLLAPGVGLPQVMAAIKDPQIRAAVEYLMAKGVLPKVPLPKSAMTTPPQVPNVP